MFAALFEQQDKPYKNYAKDAISNIYTPNSLADLFFSNQNVDALQLGIKNLVYEKSCNKFLIGKQNQTELRIIMKSIYLEHAKHSLGNNNLIPEVRKLNGLILEFSVPRIIQEINMYEHYKKDVGIVALPMDRGTFISSKGTRFLEQKEF